MTFSTNPPTIKFSFCSQRDWCVECNLMATRHLYVHRWVFSTHQPTSNHLTCNRLHSTHHCLHSTYQCFRALTLYISTLHPVLLCRDTRELHRMCVSRDVWNETERRYICTNFDVYMEVRAKKALGQHFLTDLSIAQRIADALIVPCPGLDTVHDASNPMPALEVGPGMGVLTQYVLQRPEVDLRMVEIDTESVDYLLVHFPQVNGKLIAADFLKLKLETFFPGQFCVIGNFPYNISSQIFFKVLDYKEQVPQVVCMIQKEVAERIAEKPGTKTYGILSVLLQAWYDIEYLFTVGEGAFNPPPKVKSAVIRLVRNQRTELGCDEALFKTVVKTGFNQRRKTLRNSLKPLIRTKADREGWSEDQLAEFVADPVFELRPERLSVEDFIALTLKLA